jgi:putative restriction endonuclease
MRKRIEHYRKQAGRHLEDYTIGCIILTQPFFLAEAEWVSVPTDWSQNIVQGKTYDLTREPGLSLFQNIQQAISRFASSKVQKQQDTQITPQGLPRYGTEIMITPRLGQGAFRIIVTDAYERRCSVTGERVLPVLQAAHIRPYSDGGLHSLQNGILLRSDLHALLDRGYVTVNPQLRLEVSRKIKEEFENGQEYYALHGRQINVPVESGMRPLRENLIWHNEQVYRG